MKAPHQQTVRGGSEKDLYHQSKVISVFYILLSFNHLGSTEKILLKKSMGCYSLISMGFSCYPAKTTVQAEVCSDIHSKFSHALFHLMFPIISAVWAKQLIAF